MRAKESGNPYLVEIPCGGDVEQKKTYCDHTSDKKRPGKSKAIVIVRR